MYWSSSWDQLHCAFLLIILGLLTRWGGSVTWRSGTTTWRHNATWRTWLSLRVAGAWWLRRRTRWDTGWWSTTSCARCLGSRAWIWWWSISSRSRRAILLLILGRTGLGARWFMLFMVFFLTWRATVGWYLWIIIASVNWITLLNCKDNDHN